MWISQSSRMQLASVDYGYILLACIAGVWQAWCFNYGSNRLLVLVVIAMSLPFALSTYAHAAFLRRARLVAELPDWKRMLILWAGMPLSLTTFSLVSLAETRLMYSLGFGLVDLPYYQFRLLVGEAAACLVWAICLLMWSRQAGTGVPRNSLLEAFAILFVGVLFANGLAYLVLKLFNRDFYFYFESVVATTISAFIAITSRRQVAPISRGIVSS